MSEKHECKRFKTAKKVGGVRLLVRCRECGKARLARKPAEPANLP